MSLLQCCLILHIVFLFAALDGIQACYKSRQFFQSRDRGKAHVLVLEEFQPPRNERNLDASGPLDNKKDLISEPPNNILIRAEGSHLEFANENAHWMTQGCHDRLQKLVTIIQNKWPNQGVNIRVRDAWVPAAKSKKLQFQGKKTVSQEKKENSSISEKSLSTILSRKRRAPQSREMIMEEFHHAGRAIDMLLVLGNDNVQNVHLGKLAELARYYAGFDWCIYTKHGYVHCSVKPDSYIMEEWFGCFHGDSTVNLESRGPVPINQIKIGDRIQAVTRNGDVVFSPVVMFLHQDSEIKIKYITLVTESGRRLVLTPDHLIYTIDSKAINYSHDFSKSKAVFADRVLPDNLIFIVQNNKAVQVDKIIRIERFEGADRGAYAPLTEQGNLVVNGIAASSYSHFENEAIANLVMSPYIAFYKINSYLKELFWKPVVNGSRLQEQQDRGTPLSNQGVHWYPKFLWDLARVYLPPGLLHST